LAQQALKNLKSTMPIIEEIERSKRNLFKLPFDLIDDFKTGKKNSGIKVPTSSPVSSNVVINDIEDSVDKLATNEADELDISTTFTLSPTGSESNYDTEESIPTINPTMTLTKEVDIETSTITNEPSELDFSTTSSPDEEEEPTSGTLSISPTTIVSEKISQEETFYSGSSSSSNTLFPTENEDQDVSSSQKDYIPSQTNESITITTSITYEPSDAFNISSEPDESSGSGSGSATLLPSMSFSTTSSSFEIFNSTFKYVGKSTVTSESAISSQTDVLMLISLSAIFVTVLAIFIKSSRGRDTPYRVKK